MMAIKNQNKMELLLKIERVTAKESENATGRENGNGA